MYTDVDVLMDMSVFMKEAPELAAWLSGLLPDSTMHVGRFVRGTVTWWWLHGGLRGALDHAHLRTEMMR